MLDGHISTCFHKDTRDLFMLCIMLMCQLHRVVFYYSCLIILLLFDFHSSFVHALFDFCVPFNSFACSQFVVQRKKFNPDPGLHSRYLKPAVPLYKKYHHHLYKSINIIHQTAPSLSQYRSELPITIIDIVGYTKSIISKS